MTEFTKGQPSDESGEAVAGLGLGAKETPASPPEPGRAEAVLPVFQLKKILVPVDFSSCSKKALQYAIPLARQFGAELMLLHVIEPAVVLPMSETLPQVIVEPDETARQNLEEFREAVGEGISSKTLMRSGSPHLEILDAAKELDIDLVILSTHGRTGLSHVLLGGTAEKVVRRLACPVLVVREHEHEFIRVGDFTG